MSVTKAYDVAHVRFTAPDLDQMRDFLMAFGMVEAERSSDRLFMRGCGPSPYVHLTESGEPGFAGFAFRLNSEADLRALAQSEGVSIEEIDGPGGGRRVRLIDPDGFTVDAIHGVEPVDPIAFEPSSPWNEGQSRARVGVFRRVRPGPSHVLRLGHVVLAVSDFHTSEAWYKERFGLLTSDEIQPEPGVAIGAFMRCDRGSEPCDHHTLFLMQRPAAPAGFMHAAFEVAGVDDLMAGHEHLVEMEAKSVWGVGRHLLGSQVFDYWTDPWGHEVEHWTDGDQLTAADPGGIASIQELIGVQWGMPIPPHPGLPPMPERGAAR